MENMNMDEIRARVEQEKQNSLPTVVSDMKSQIDKEYERQSQELANNEAFQKLTEEIVIRSAKASLTKDMIAILTEEQKNELTAYFLEMEKEKLKFRRSKEKKIVIEEIKADISNRKIEALKKRFGYLYKETEQFIPSKTYNINREVVNWWNGTSNDFKRMVKGTLKIIMWGTIGFLVVYFGYEIVKWLINNTNIILPQTNAVIMGILPL